MKDVIILALDRTLASTVTGPLDILGQAGVLWNLICNQTPEPFFRVRIASLDGRPVTCHNEVIIRPHLAMDEVDRTDLILISAENLASLDRASDPAAGWLKERFADGASIASICTGAFLLAETGLLNGKRATTHWGFADLFRRRYPEVLLQMECLITDEGNLFCSGGAYSYFDLTLYLVEKYCGYETATRAARSLLLDMGRTSQTPYAIFEYQKKHGDAGILKAQERIEAYFSEDINIDFLADYCGMSVRSFKRRFKQATGDAPLRYLQRFRIESAKRLLEKSALSVEEISGRAGYRDAAFFRELFKRYTGISPSEYRRRFRGNDR